LEAWDSVTDAGGCLWVYAEIKYYTYNGLLATGYGAKSTVTSKAWAANANWLSHTANIWNTSNVYGYYSF
jgi:hypothetical protein